MSLRCTGTSLRAPQAPRLRCRCGKRCPLPTPGRAQGSGAPGCSDRPPRRCPRRRISRSRSRGFAGPGPAGQSGFSPRRASDEGFCPEMGPGEGECISIPGSFLREDLVPVLRRQNHNFLEKRNIYLPRPGWQVRVFREKIAGILCCVLYVKKGLLAFLASPEYFNTMVWFNPVSSKFQCGPHLRESCLPSKSLEVLVISPLFPILLSFLKKKKK